MALNVGRWSRLLLPLKKALQNQKQKKIISTWKAQNRLSLKKVARKPRKKSRKVRKKARTSRRVTLLLNDELAAVGVVAGGVGGAGVGGGGGEGNCFGGGFGFVF